MESVETLDSLESKKKVPVKLNWTGALESVHEAEMDKFTKFSKEKIEAHYDEVAINYEGIYLKAGYPDPEWATKYALKMCSKSNIPKEKA
jgi:hypothetical protein